MASRNDDNKILRCSFCNKTQDQVRKLIAGPGAYICDECVNICSDIIEEEMKNDRIRWLMKAFPDLTEEGVEKVAEYMKDICQLPKYSRRKWRDEGKENNGDT